MTEHPPQPRHGDSLQHDGGGGDDEERAGAASAVQPPLDAAAGRAKQHAPDEHGPGEGVGNGEGDEGGADGDDSGGDGDDDDESDESSESDDDEEEDEEPRLKYAPLTQHLRAVYRNGDATSASLVAGDKMVGRMESLSLGSCSC